MSKPKRPPTRTPEPAAPAEGVEKKGGQAVRLPADVYEDLLRLQAVYLGRNLGEIAELLIRRGLEEDAEVLRQLRSLQKKS